MFWCVISQITNCFFRCFHKYFPLCSKKTITELVSCFIGSLVVKVIKDRFEALKKGAIRKGVCPWSNRDLLVIMVNRSDKIAKSRIHYAAHVSFKHSLLLFRTCSRYCWNYCHFIFCATFCFLVHYFDASMGAAAGIKRKQKKVLGLALAFILTLARFHDMCCFTCTYTFVRACVTNEN